MKYSFSLSDNITILHEYFKGKKLDLIEKMGISRTKRGPVVDLSACQNLIFNIPIQNLRSGWLDQLLNVLHR